MIRIVDFEVFKFDWLMVGYDIESNGYTFIHNDNEALIEYMADRPTLGGFNVKHYDNWIAKAIIGGFDVESVKRVNDWIISGHEGWEMPELRNLKIYFDSFDLMDDMQKGYSLKSIEGHLGYNITETGVDFNIDRPLTEEEVKAELGYCKYDVDMAYNIFKLRKNYFKNKITLGREKGLSDGKAMYMTNAKITAFYLDAVRPEKDYNDERCYKYPANLKGEYIPQEVFNFFDRIYDKDLSDDECFDASYEFDIDDCQCKVAFGGIHGAIPTYREKATEHRSIRNVDVSSYYPHLMTIDGYCSRNMPNAKVYADMLERRINAKKAGNKQLANALKLVCNTTYGAMLNQYNNLYDPLMVRSVCITGQLRLLELANNLRTNCRTCRIIQLNTDGIMISIDQEDVAKYQEIITEWQDRTGFELEEDLIKEIIQKDVNNYIEVATDESLKLKGEYVVRGISEAGAWKINNNATIIPEAIINYLTLGVEVEDTINGCNDPMKYQLIAKASSKYSSVYQIIDGEQVEVQRCNRVYATTDKSLGCLYKVHKETGRHAKIEALPMNCLVFNDDVSNMVIDNRIDKKWYIKEAKRKINEFLGIEEPKIDKRKYNKCVKELQKAIEEL